MTIWDPRTPAEDQPLRPVPLPAFGGLNLKDDPQQVGWEAAIDLSNVELDRQGRVRSRDGYTALLTAPAAVRGIGTYRASSHLLVSYKSGSSGLVRAYNSSGVQIGAGASTGATASTGRACFAEMGLVSGGVESSRTFFSIDGFADVFYHDGTAQTQVVVGSAGGPIAVQPNDNRLAVANSSRISFSDEGAPTTFGANNFVLLTPGDGEKIVSLVAWQNLLFAFKQSKFFVFYGNNTDSSGATVFNYREMRYGTGVSYDSSSATLISYGAAAGRDGVYFVHDTGVYRTTGGAPERISDSLTPLFRGETPSYSTLTPPTVDGEKVLTVVDNRLYLSMSDGTDMRLFVHDLTDRWWTAYSIKAGPMLPYYTSAGRTDWAFAIDGTTGIYRHGSAYTTDNGAAIDSSYRTGFADLGTPGTQKLLRELLLDGYGSPTVKVAVNDGSLDTGAAVTLGTSPAVAQGRRRSAYRGRNFSVQFGASSAWGVSRAVAHLRSERPPGIG